MRYAFRYSLGLFGLLAACAEAVTPSGDAPAEGTATTLPPGAGSSVPADAPNVPDGASVVTDGATAHDGATPTDAGADPSLLDASSPSDAALDTTLPPSNVCPAAPDGGVTVCAGTVLWPATGDTPLSAIDLQTTMLCPPEAVINATRLFGAGMPAEGLSVTPPLRTTNRNTNLIGGYTMPFQNTLDGLMNAVSPRPTITPGEYTAEVLCFSDSLAQKRVAVMTGKACFTDATHFVFPCPP